LAIVENLRRFRNLDAKKDISHWTFRIPGLITWSILIGFVLMMLFVPNSALEIARMVGFYALLRIGWMVFFYFVGLVRILREERRIRANPPSESNVHHLVIIPNYQEPAEVLAKTLDSLSRARCASQHMTVVLAMEAKDPLAEKCAAVLVQQFSNRFAHMIVTFHPANLPGEVPGKAANQTWAAFKARTQLVDQLKMDINRIIVTSSDADTSFHPAYFDVLGEQFSAEANPHNRIWQPPIMFDSNIWKVPIIIRLMTYYINAIQLSELTNPLSFAMPISSYSLSFRLAEEVGYWDPLVISDDYHMFLRCMFARRGDLKLLPIFLPASGETVGGENLFKALKNFYNQQVRHAWGVEDTAYILQQWNKNPGTPFGKKVSRLFKSFFDHNIVAMMTMIIFLGTGLAIFLRGEPILTIAGNYAFPPVVLVSNGISVFTTIMMWIAEHWRCAKVKGNWRPIVFLIELVTWAVMPFFSMALIGMPYLHAETKMLVGSPLVFARTPKGLEYESS
jgi:cellulose synthase/poly-beta-1,6-N-acetylglucosamine synthase-like glycosyltransferase